MMTISARIAALLLTLTQMIAPPKHHVVRFPNCELHFDYSADLTPDPDFVMQWMETDVDYRTIRWETPGCSRSFIEMDAQLKSGFFKKTVAAVSVSMWLGATPKSFTGDVTDPDQLERGEVALHDSLPGEASSILLEKVVIGGRAWAFNRATGIYMTGLQEHLILRVKVGVSGDFTDNPKSREAADEVALAILQSLRIQPRALAVVPAS
jgi:hypothetical protein